MSRLGDILRKALQTSPPALGFRPTAPAKPRMVLVAILNELGEDLASRVEGADAIVLGPNIKMKEAKGTAKTMPAPWGVWVDGSAQAARQAETAGADFIAFEPFVTGIDNMSIERPGKMMSVDISIENAVLHSVNEMPIEAVYLQREPRNAITWLDLMQIRRLADLVAKPLLVPVAPDIPPAQLKTLWETGVDGVVIASLAPGEMAAIRRKMDDLVLPPRRKWLRARPLVPVVSSTLGLPHQEEEPDEEEEE